MNLWFRIVRVVAFVLIVSGVADFCAFDIADPTASMSAAGEFCASPSSHVHHVRPGTVKPGDLPDDCCLWCGTAVPIRPMELAPAESVSVPYIPEVVHPSDLVPFRLYRPPKA